MLDPRNTSKPPLLSRVATGLALLLAGIFGVLVMCLIPGPTRLASKVEVVREQPVAAAPEGDGAVLVRYAAPQAPAPATGKLVEFCASHVTQARSFVVFSRGSCVLVNEPAQDPVAEAVRLLKSCAESEARFVPERTREGDLIVGFKEPVFHRFSSRELEDLAPWLEQVSPSLMTPKEVVSAGKDWVPPYYAQVGLLARRRVQEDASQPVAVRVIRAKSQVTAAK